MSLETIKKFKDFVLDSYFNRLDPEIRRFIYVGLIATGLHYGIFYIFLNYSQLGYKISYSIGYFASLLVNYFLSNYYTFKSKPNVLNSIGFAASHGINFLLHFILMILFVEWIGFPPEIAPVFVYAIAIPVNFFLVRFVLTSKLFLNK